MDKLKDEVEYRESQGLRQLSKEEVCELFRDLGYILEVSDPCYYTGLYKFDTWNEGHGVGGNEWFVPKGYLQVIPEGG